LQDEYNKATANVLALEALRKKLCRDAENSGDIMSQEVQVNNSLKTELSLAPSVWLALATNKKCGCAPVQQL